MRIAIAQINSTLGDFQTNFEKIKNKIKQAADRKASMVVFPECALFGYHPFDLLERHEVVREQEKYISRIQKIIPKDMAVIVGLMKENKALRGRPYFNAAAFIEKGKKPKFFYKQLLPTGDVFDEARFIEAGQLKDNYFQWKGHKFFLTICEDIWSWPEEKSKKSPYKSNPFESIPKKKIDLVINLSASPFFLGKQKLRDHVTVKTAQHFKAPIMYVNLVGAQDEIIFDGASFVVDPKGKKLLTCQSFEEDLNVYDLKTKESWAEARPVQGAESLRRALVLGIQDFCFKSGLQKIHLGLSGGIDSAVVAALAVDALGPQNVKSFALPGPFSSEKSLNLAKQLAKSLQIDFSEIQITSAYEEVLKTLSQNLDFEAEVLSTTHENLQSRLRGLYLMAYSNMTQSLLLTTGNKSEYATGYSTLYGDMCGGLAPIGDLLKRQVYELAKHYNQEHELIPNEIITRAPTAELRPNQKDQDSLPSYDKLDQAVQNIVEQSKPAKTETDRWLLQKVISTEFKRWQSAPILKVSSHSFGRGRRYPLAHKAFRKN